ncbi:MAG: hypothetical protein AB7I42_22805 [Bradyrhizobium sp.]|uniref:hypothetical protein n=1 Tax=Bradyrhizobium sp. TaxID=376 RepID=UPI003D14FD19
MTRCGCCYDPAPRVAACGGDACEMRVGPCCMSRDGLCIECEREEQRARDRDVLVRLAGARVAGEQVPLLSIALCALTRLPADECEHIELDEVEHG